MKTKILKLNPNDFSDFDLDLPAQMIREGKLVAFPTETVYGLGANALDGEACDRIFAAKGRPKDNPLIVHVLSPSDFETYADVDSPLLDILTEKFMPGPLTVIMPKKRIIPDSVTVGLQTVALRCPEHPIARALIRKSGVPIAAPSANRSGKPSPTSAAHVIEDLDGRVDMIIDGGTSKVGLESTVIALKGDWIHLLRPGFVTAEDLFTITDKVKISDSVLPALQTDEKPESPGMKYRHYAPSVPVTVVKGEDRDVIAFFRKKCIEGCGILCFLEDLPQIGLSSDRICSFGSRFDLNSQANSLFGALRYFDGSHVTRVYARAPTQKDLGLAISNRLFRACAFDFIDISKEKNT